MLNGARILVAEDEPLIAMELAQTIEEAGGTLVASARTHLEALRFAEEAECDVALLDVRLRDGSAFEAAAILAARGIPFLFCTADSGDRSQFAPWPDAPIVAKPHHACVILDALSRLLPSRS